MSQQLNRKIVVVGAPSVGKSSLTMQFVESVFSDNYQPTINASFTKSYKYKNNNYNLEIHDTAGIDEFTLLNTQFANVHGVVLVYSITSRQSFTMLMVIRDKILQLTGLDNIPTVLVGNKCDLSNREVEYEEAKQLSTGWKGVAIESSAKLNKNIDAIFQSLIDIMERKETSKCVLM